jgi:hypothetical protein
MRNQTIAQEGVERRYGGQTLKAKTQPADEPGARIKYAARKARRGIPPSVQDSFPTTGSAAVRRGCCAGCGQSRYTDRACIGYVLIHLHKDKQLSLPCPQENDSCRSKVFPFG